VRIPETISHSSGAAARRREFIEANRPAGGSTQSQYSTDIDHPARLSRARASQSGSGARTLQELTSAMPRLKIGALDGEKPVEVTIELPAAVDRDLKAYAEVIKRESGHSVADPTKLIAPMLKRFIATDRAFRRLRRQVPQNKAG
jgi:hypothetical protein